MRIHILTFGTRGDVQPMIALGLGLRRAGHSVCVVASPNFEQLIRGYGLDCAAMRDEVRLLLDKKEAKTWAGPGQSVLTVAYETQLRMWEDSWVACQDAEAIIDETPGWGYHIAEKLGVPYYLSRMFPFHPTRAFPSVFMPGLPFRIGYNILTHKISQQVVWQSVRQPINQWRQHTLGLAPLPFSGPYRRQERQQVPVLYGYSSAVLPKPPDWPARIHATGFWFLDPPSDWQPPPALVDFLGSGPPPVYIGFGSMVTLNPEEALRIATRALTQARRRGILLDNWRATGSSAVTDDILVVSDIPHTWLFRRMAAIVQHGGAGTTSSALRAGVPTVVVPFFADQPFWAERMVALGVGPRPIPRKQLSAERLAAAILATDDEPMRQHAAALGERIRAEDGVANAVDAFHAGLASELWRQMRPCA